MKNQDSFRQIFRLKTLCTQNMGISNPPPLMPTGENVMLSHRTQFQCLRGVSRHAKALDATIVRSTVPRTLLNHSQFEIYCPNQWIPKGKPHTS